MRIREKLFLLILCLAVLSVTSCEMFTHSMFKGAARDLSKTMEKVSTEDLIASGSDPNVVSNPESSKAAIEALGKRPEELENITVEQAENVLNLATSAVLPTSTLMNVLDQVLNTETGDDTNTEGSSETSNLLATTLLTAIQNAPEMDTTAVEIVLGKEEVLKEGDITTVTLATVSLAATAMKSADVESEEALQEAISSVTENIGKLTENSKDLSNTTAEEFIDEALKDTEFEDSDAMKTAMNALYYLMQRDDFANLLGDTSNEESEDQSNV